MQAYNQAHSRVYNIINTYHLLLRVYYEYHKRNHNLPPPKIRDQASKFFPKLCVFPLLDRFSLSLFLFFLFSLFKPSFFYPD